MYKRIIALILVLTMVFPTNITMLSFAGEGPSSALPSVSRASAIPWEGKKPTIGDNTFYIEIVGEGFLNFPNMVVEVFTKDDNNDFVKVASQIESRYMGKTMANEDWFISKMKMEGSLVLEENQDYYININDGSDTYLIEDWSEYGFTAYKPTIGGVDEMNTRQIASTATQFPIEFDMSGYDDAIASNDLTIQLIKAEGMDLKALLAILVL